MIWKLLSLSWIYITILHQVDYYLTVMVKCSLSRKDSTKIFCLVVFLWFHNLFISPDYSRRHNKKRNISFIASFVMWIKPPNLSRQTNVVHFLFDQIDIFCNVTRAETFWFILFWISIWSLSHHGYLRTGRHSPMQWNGRWYVWFRVQTRSLPFSCMKEQQLHL